jgi:predicted kinase
MQNKGEIMKAIVTVGISSSGKSQWAKEYAKKNKAIISNRDDMRFSLTGCSGCGDYKFDKKIESIITCQQTNLAMVASKLGKDLIVADTNLNPDYRNTLVTNLEDLGYEVEIKDFPITLEEAWKRNAIRANSVNHDVIYKQWQQWLKYIGRKQYVPNESLPKAVMFDIDGTLAHMNGRKPYDWDNVHRDTCDKFVVSMANNFNRDGYDVLFVSGRDGVCRDKTLNWLDYQVDFVVNHTQLFMREANDNRKDTVIKEEIFWRDIAPYYNVQAVVDDRPCVVRMWHDIGIKKVIAVGNQCVEF